MNDDYIRYTKINNPFNSSLLELSYKQLTQDPRFNFELYYLPYKDI